MNQTENKIAYIDVNPYQGRRTTFDISAGEDEGSFTVDVMLGHEDAINLLARTLDMISCFSDKDQERVKNILIGVAKEKGWV